MISKRNELITKIDSQQRGDEMGKLTNIEIHAEKIEDLTHDMVVECGDDLATAHGYKAALDYWVGRDVFNAIIEGYYKWLDE